MEGMSDIRNGIEQRLGVFARPGAKAAFATEVGRKGNKAAMISRDPNGGWKAWVVQRGSTGIDQFEDILGGMRSYATEEKAKRAVIAALDTSGFSRPGAKAEMSKATDALDYIKSSIANGKTVYVQAGSRTTKITPQTYAKWEASGRPLFKMSSDGALLMASGSSYVRLTLADEMLARVSAMSRPGAKATFASDVDLVMEQARKMHSNWKPIAERDQNKPNAGTRGGVEGYASSAIHFLENHIRDLKKYSKRADKKEAEAAKAGLKEVADMMKYWEAMYRKVTASRPGAKSTHAADGFYGGSEADAVRHMAAYDKTCAECNAEDTKLGDKIAMATDPAVSKKIGKLMDEGYPQNQAIAIALEMKRKGEI